MAWPTTATMPAPTFDTTMMAVPNSALTVVDATNPIYLLGGMISNPTAGLITLLITNTAGDQIMPTMEIPAGMVIPLAIPFQPCAGLKWQASAVGLKAQLWGYK